MATKRKIEMFSAVCAVCDDVVALIKLVAMKRVLLAALLAVALAGVAIAADVAANVYRLTVDGLACPFCAYGVEKQLAAIAGVGKLATDIAAGTVTITMKPDGVLDETRARRAVEAAGFSLRGFEQVPPRR